MSAERIRSRFISVAAPPALAALLLAGCAPKPPPVPEEPLRVQPIVEEAPVRAGVTDLGRFAEFIATRPTPAALKERYPGLAIVLPGQIATKEFRTDNSRYFAELDAEGRIVGGRFQ